MQVSMVESVSFKGKAVKAPTRVIKGAKDAINQWQILRHPAYTNIYQESEHVSEALIRENKAIREQNYAFLDELRGKKAKKAFIEHFKETTGFPVLVESSKKIVQEFRRVLDVANARINGGNSKVLVSGYDRYCSVGLNSALPASDLDKGYAIVKGVKGGLGEQKMHSDKIKGAIWNSIDNRIMSVNHCAAFPNIMTDTEIALSLNKFDKYAKEFVRPEDNMAYLGERLRNDNPISGSKFNVWLSEHLPNREERINAKNFAYFVETLRDGNRLHQYDPYMDVICDQMNKSYFGWYSNITQQYTMEQKYAASDIDMLKKKLKARKDIEQNFDSWGVDRQYELVKDVIRSMSGDNKNPDFKDLFYSKPDRHRLLINDILTGDVGCVFENLGRGNEQTYLHLKTPEAVQKYYDLNVYKTDY